jgi:murein DD-endopeptidase MepM/ murein hydrolase activator NlpD
VIALRLAKWGAIAIPGLTLLLCLCLSLVTVPRYGGQLSSEFQPGDDYDPGPATCANEGIAYPDNPFSGWPQRGRTWRDINYSYCAANYQQEFGRTHWGVDVQAYHREALYATASATVAWAYHDTRYGMGKTVKLCTPSGWCAVYMHLDEWVVSTGQDVQRGQLVGYADNTGFSTGTHLHYQINNPAGQPVDPALTFGPRPPHAALEVSP